LHGLLGLAGEVGADAGDLRGGGQEHGLLLTVRFFGPTLPLLFLACGLREGFGGGVWEVFIGGGCFVVQEGLIMLEVM
jgi:hypothetical protein